MKFVAHKWMVGYKNGIQFGDGLIAVSPTIYSLLESERGKSLNHLLDNLQILRLPEIGPPESIIPSPVKWDTND